MATIKQRKQKFSIIYWYYDDNNKRKQKWDTLETRNEARQRRVFVEYYQQQHGQVLVPLEEQFKEEIEKAKRKTSNPEEDILFKDFLELFVNSYGVSKWSANTYSNKIATINNYINPFLGDMKLSDITTKVLTKYYADLLSTPAVSSSYKKKNDLVQSAGVKKIHDIIRCALNQALRWEYLDPRMRNPASLATLPKIPKVRRKVWDIETFKLAILRCDDVLRLCMHLAFSCSLRIGEICGLTWDDVIIDEETIENDNARVIVNKELSRVSHMAIQNL